MTIQEYLRNVNDRYRQGIATEHTYRGDLQTLLETFAPGIQVTNEPTRIECGAPDYILTKGKIPVGYIEAKDIGKPLDSKEYKEQFDRYRKSLDNLIITDYLDFQLFVEGQPGPTVRIADIEKGRIVPRPEKYSEFEGLIKNFVMFTGQTIKSPAKLSRMMAAKAKLLAAVIENALTKDARDSGNMFQDSANRTLRDQLEAFKQVLIHDITESNFADIYAQTIAYGMFAARLHDPSLQDFSRQEAAELIPHSNPFLRKLFQYIAGYDLDDRIRWIVDDLADIFRATDVSALLKDFGKATQQQDPMIHFYETFLSEYNPALRKSRGVWYTPEPVVNFIVRAVDDILKEEFGLPQGLADTSKIKVKVPVLGKMVEQEVHRVQVLDPACGTGTFLAEVVRQIYKRFEGQQGIWSQYVEDHLLPRLNGFEILMASYAMAHLKLELLLKETGYRPTRSQRLKIYLTNSLEEHHRDTGTLFASWLSQEANEANHVKRDTPVMVVLGNPPYSGHSSNKGQWIEGLIQDYFIEPSGGKLQEKNAKWLNDDYVKFLRYAQHLITKNQEGILAFITNNGYLDNPTFRGMRYNLLQTFDIIYSIDLHGSSKKQEKNSEGNADKNIFDIQQGVALFIAIKKKEHKKDKEFYTSDILGNREFKYDFLLSNSLSAVSLIKNNPIKPNYVFKNVDYDLFKNYDKQLSLIQLFPINVMGFQTHRDDFAISFSSSDIESRVSDLLNLNINDADISSKYNITDNRDWQLSTSRKNILKDANWKLKITKCSYRPFDFRYCYFSYVMMDYPRKEMIQHVSTKDNIVLGIGRQGIAVGDIDWCLATISKYPVDANVFRRGGVNLCPLYLYPEDDQQEVAGLDFRKPNLNLKIVNQIAEFLHLQFTSEKEATEGTFAPIDILDYIYAFLHSPTYREKYKEFLKIDFPRIPYPKDQETFWKFVKLGSELRQIHLLESPVVEQFITSYPVSGSNEVEKIRFEYGKVWINDSQHFDRVPQIAWEFYIGGYQPAQKWLKDRKGRQLSFEDVRHYQKIIVALTETDRLMKEIDKIEFE